MIYLLCIICPPLAVLLKGKPIQALLNCCLLLLFWIPASIHAFAVVNKANGDKRHKEMIEAIKENKEIKKEVEGD